MKFLHTLSTITVLAAQLFSVPMAHADPISTSNRSAFARLYGLPLMTDARVLPKSQSQHRLVTELSSQFVVKQSANESLFLDGETTALIYTWRYGLLDKLDIALQIPWLRHSGGSLDSSVEKWHDWFGLPNGGRERYPQNQLQFSWQTPAQDIQFNQTGEGLGDIGLRFMYELAGSQEYALSSHVRLDAPTGDFRRFTGSDKWDAAIGLDFSHYGWLHTWGGEVYGQLGVLQLGQNTSIKASKSAVYYGGLGLSLPVFKHTQAKVQLESHTPFFNSEIDALADNAFQLSFGFDVKLNSAWQLDIAMSEDISPTTAPDFTFHLGLHYIP